MDASVVERLAARAVREGVDASSVTPVGQLLAALAASKPNGWLLELGTGFGLGTASLLSGMTGSAHLVTVELNKSLSLAAQQELHDPRVEWVLADGGEWFDAQDPDARRYDLVFADTWPGKISHLEQALELVAPGGLYVIDDLVPKPGWPPEHRQASTH